MTTICMKYKVQQLSMTVFQLNAGYFLVFSPTVSLKSQQSQVVYYSQHVKHGQRKKSKKTKSTLNTVLKPLLAAQLWS